MRTVQLGLKENWRQFTLLVIVNAFIGGMIGLERSIFPQFAADVFGVASKTAILSFITAFWNYQSDYELLHWSFGQ